MLHLNDRSGLSNADTLLFGLAYATLIFTVIYYITGLHEAFRMGFATEDGPIEWGTAVCLLLSSMVLIRNARVLWTKRGAAAALITGFYAFLFFFASGEEISWGYRLFHWDANEFFLQNNAQKETNLHNLVVGDVKLVKTVFGSGLTVVILLYLLVMPLVYTRMSLVRGIAKRLAIPVPDTRHMFLALAATIVILAVQMMTKWECYEFVFSLLTLSIFLRPRNADQVT
ncbi:hypothetical protein PEL8287_01364 [Roseovarius litorisediminis]|uniref:Uncharacterized protein n=1 Tax=Roseovarius litorisediminis TaxID=1312363 RepID=A0A1Y5S4R4_9RHOB|nr:hypothetical protein [Roseovarius litorisediminis]SLN29753.1 hypothetical protein PEL8287_01364 [Roseovarius litorisediminis]